MTTISRPLPANNFVLHVPHCPCRQENGIATPCSSAASKRVWPLRKVHVFPERANSTMIPASGGSKAEILAAEGAPKLSCLIRSGFTPRSIRMPRPASMNAGGPQRKKSWPAGSSTALSMNSRLTRPRSPVHAASGCDRLTRYSKPAIRDRNCSNSFSKMMSAFVRTQYSNVALISRHRSSM